MDIIAKCKEAVGARGPKVVLPESGDDRILEAAAQVMAEGWANPVIVGRRDLIDTRADALALNLAGADIRDCEQDPSAGALAGLLAHRRPSVTRAMAERLVRKPLYFGGALVAAGETAAMVAGVAHPTRRVIEAGLMTIGLKPGITTPSSFFLMLVPSPGDG